MTPWKTPRAAVVAALALVLPAAAFAAAQEQRDEVEVPQVDAAGAPPVSPATSALEGLVGPIALYPDPLVALILPASTMPEDISAAQAYLVQYGDATQIDRQPWDPSVRGLAHYPAVLQWLMDNAAWTQALGEAFLASPANVMRAIQRLRARALAEGVLVSTPQQRVFSDNGQIEILPSQPDSIFIPGYEPDEVFGAQPDGPYGGPPVSYGAPCEVGPWLSYGIDWDSGGLWAGGWDAWHSPGGWYRPHYNGAHGPPGIQPWRPKGKTVMPLPPEHGIRSAPVPHPRPIQGANAPSPPRVRPLAPTALPLTSRGAPVEPHTGASDPRYGAPLPSHGDRGAQSLPRGPPRPAPQPRSAPAPSAPSAPREAPPPTQDPRNH